MCCQLKYKQSYVDTSYIESKIGTFYTLEYLYTYNICRSLILKSNDVIGIKMKIHGKRYVQSFLRYLK